MPLLLQETCIQNLNLHLWGSNPQPLGQEIEYFIGSALSWTFLHSYQFLIFLTLVLYCCHHGNHFYANANTDTYTCRVVHNLSYQWDKEIIINYTSMALYMSLYGDILN